MRKLFTLIITAILFAGTANAQVFSSNFDTWSGGVPTDWMGTRTSIYADSVIQVAGSGSYGTNAAQLVNTTTSHKRFTTQGLTSVAGQSYEIKFWAKGVGEIRSGLVDSDYHYSDYIAVNSTSWTEYTQVVTCVNAVDTAQFMLSVRSTSGTDHLMVDRFVVNTTTASTISLYDIQYTTDVSGDSPYNGQTVNTGGIVTGISLTGNYYIQSGEGAWNGVYVYDGNNTVNYGDSVTFTCTVSEYFNLTELKNIANFTIVSSGNSLYNPVTLSTDAVNDEQYEGVLVKVVNAKCTNADAGNGQFIVNDNSGQLYVDDQAYHFTAALNAYYDITGVVDFSFSEYKILPRGATDIEISSDVELVNNNSIVSVYPNPANDVVFIKSSKIISNISFYNIVGEQVKTVNNINKIDISSLKEGIYVVKVQFTDNSSSTTRLNVK